MCLGFLLHNIWDQLDCYPNSMVVTHLGFLPFSLGVLELKLLLLLYRGRTKIRVRIKQGT